VVVEVTVEGFHRFADDDVATSLSTALSSPARAGLERGSQGEIEGGSPR
jgi:hypothetical protein